MSVNEVTPAANRYVGNGSTSVFAYTFSILSSAHLEVLVNDVVQTLGTHYTLSGVGASGGGNVTFTLGNAPASGATVTLLRKQPAEQQSEYTLEPFPPERIEQDFDKAVMLLQQILEILRRTPSIKKSSTLANLVLPVAASGFLRWNATGTQLETAAVDTENGLALTLPEDILLSSDYATYQAAVTAAGSGLQELWVVGVIPATADVTVPTTLTVRVFAPGDIQVASGVTVTHNGPLLSAKAAPYSGAGTVVQSSAGITETIHARTVHRKAVNPNWLIENTTPFAAHVGKFDILMAPFDQDTPSVEFRGLNDAMTVAGQIISIRRTSTSEPNDGNALTAAVWAMDFYIRSLMHHSAGPHTFGLRLRDSDGNLRIPESLDGMPAGSDTPSHKAGLLDAAINHAGAFKPAVLFSGSAAGPLINPTRGIWSHPTLAPVNEKSAYGVELQPYFVRGTSGSHPEIATLIVRPPQLGSANSYTNETDGGAAAISYAFALHVTGDPNIGASVGQAATRLEGITQTDELRSAEIKAVPGGRHPQLRHILVIGNNGGTVAAATTAYNGPAQPDGFSVTEDDKEVVVPFNCTMKRLSVLTRSAQPAGGSLVMTVRKNEVDTAMTVTIAAGAAAGTYQDTTNSVSFTAYDRITIKAVNNDGSTASASIVSLSMEAAPEFVT